MLILTFYYDIINTKSKHKHCKKEHFMTAEHINPHIRFAMSFRYPIKGTPLVAYDARIYYVTDGSGFIASGDEKLEFHKGYIIFVPPGAPYLFISDEDVYCSCINFDFTKSNSSELTAIPPVEIGNFDCRKVRNEVFFDDFAPFNKCSVFTSAGTLIEKFEKIEYEFISKKQFYLEISSAELKGILSELMRMHVSGTAIDSKIDRVLSYIREHYSEDISNVHLSEIFGYHPYHLNRLMKAALGTTLHQYLIFYRIEMAKRFLASTDHTVFEISKMCGYNNFSNFSVDFKKKTGYTPRSYKEMSYRR